MNPSYLVIVTVSFCVLGCGSSDHPELGEVEGVVTSEGTPLSNALVTFTPVEKGRPSTSGPTDSEGRYELMYTLDAEGAIVGQHVVSVDLVVEEEDDAPSAEEWAEMTETEKREAAEEGITGPAEELPPGATDGSIIKEVKSGSNEINIEL